MEQSTIPKGKFIWRTLFVPFVLYALVYSLLNATMTYTCLNIVEFDCPLAFPISIFSLRSIEPYQTIAAIALLLVLPVIAYLLSKQKYAIWLVMPVAVLLILGTSSLAGWYVGFDLPITDGEALYYYDAIKINNPLDFIRTYEEAQPTTLLKHTRTNPPGATLNIYLLNQLLSNPRLISVAIVIICGSLSAFFMWGIIREHFPDDERLAGYVSLLLMVVPAIQVYYTNGTDPIITMSSLGVLYFVLHSNKITGVIGGILALFVVSFTTFLFVFILPVLGVYALFYRSKIRRIALIFAGVVALYLLLYIGLDFNYVNSFRVATHIENQVEVSAGLTTYANLPNYIFTRIESVAEILLFLTPFLFLRLCQGFGIAWREKSNLGLLSALAIISVLGMMGAGVWRTGETARLAMFIYPYLLLPVALVMARLQTQEWQRIALLTAVFAQTVLMQWGGIYFA